MRQETKKIALIAGSSGLVGKEVLKLLLENDQYEKVYSLVRRKSKFSHPKLNELVIDFDKLSSELSGIQKVDEIFCCLGTTMKVAGSKEAFRKVDYQYPFELSKWGKSIDAKHYLMISAMGADPGSSIFYNKTKGEVERDITILNIPKITFLRPSLLYGDRIESRLGEKIGIFFFKALSFLFVGPLKNYKAISVQKVAAAMVKNSNRESSGVSIILSGEMQ